MTTRGHNEPADELRQPLQELELAWECADAMRSAANFTDVEINWRRLLSHLEKVWIKAERVCQPFRNRFEPWQKPFRDLRKNDPLLVYLTQSRNADLHSVQDVPYLSHGTIAFKLGAAVRMQLDLTDPAPVVGPIVNLGVTYDVPLTHLGEVLRTRDPRVLGVHGCNFYADYLRQVSDTFFPRAP